VTLADNDLEIKFGADASGVQSGADEAKGAVTSLRSYLQQMADASRQQTATMASGFRQVTAAIESTSSAARSAGAGIASGMRGATDAMNQAAHSSTGLRRELIVMAHEAATGRFSRLGGSVLVLAERWQALGAVLANPVTWGFAAVAGAIGAVVAAFASVEGEVDRFQKSISSTGNFAGVTASQFEEMAQRMAASSNVGVGHARDILQQLVASGRFTSAELSQLGSDTQKFADLTGQKTDEVQKGWIKLADAPSRYVQEFDATYHAFSLAQVEHIRLLEEQGDKEGATAEAVKDLTHWLDQQSTSVTGLTALVRTLGNAWDATVQAFQVGIGARQLSDAQQIAEINAQIAHLQQNPPASSAEQAKNDQEIASLTQRRDLLVGVTQAAGWFAQAEADGTRLQAAANDAYEKSHQTFLSLKSSAEQAALAVKSLHDEMAKRLAANPGDAEAQDYFANEAKYDDALRRRIDRADYRKPKQDPSRVGDWQTQFDQTEVQNSNDLGGVVLNKDQDAAAYWQTILDTETLSAKEREEVERKLAEAKNALLKQNAQAVTDSAREQTQTVEAAATEQLAAQKAAIETQISSIEDAGKEGLISRQEVAAKVRALLDQEVADERAAAQKILAARVALDNATMAQYAPGTTEYQKALDDKLAAETAFEKSVSASQVAADKQYQTLLQSQQNQAVSTFERMATRIGDEWRTTMEGLIKGTTTWQSAFYKVLDGVLDSFLQMVEKQVVHWIAAEAMKTGVTNAQTAIRKAIQMVTGAEAVATTATTNVALVNSNAAVAGSAAAAAVAGIPIIGPELAIADGAATYAQVLGMFGPMASAAGGWGQIPEDQIAQVHKDEMILPASIASPLRSIISSYSAPSANLAAAAAAPLSAVTPFTPGGAQGGAAPALHVSALDGKSVQRFFDQHADKMAKSLHRATRTNRAAFA
jgi:phage-related minor tail protein